VPEIHTASSSRAEPAYGVVLPALNAARFLPALLSEIRALQPDLRVLVVDDGSSDDTAEVASELGVEVIVHPENLGKGQALNTGYVWAGEQNLDWVFTMDSDGQHLPAELQAFRDLATAQKLDIVVGTRMAATATMPWLRRQTNLFTSWVISRLAGCPIPDSQNGFRLYRVACLDDLEVRSKRYDAESEILIRLGRQGYRIGSVPVSTVYGDEVSTINPLVDTYRFFRLVLTFVFSHEAKPAQGKR